MNSISNQIIEKILVKIFEQEIINQILCELIVDSGLITQQDLQEKVNLKLDLMKNQIEVLMEQTKQNNEIPFIPYFGKPGQA